jgi:nickel-type superoxide dismutase maturation protease
MLVIRRIEGLSMMPSYAHGKIIFGFRFKRPQVGDVVIVRHHRLEIIKRVDQLHEGQVYLLGDNPEESTDSRQFGWLPTTAVIAVVVGGGRRA